MYGPFISPATMKHSMSPRKVTDGVLKVKYVLSVMAFFRAQFG